MPASNGANLERQLQRVCWPCWELLWRIEGMLADPRLPSPRQISLRLSRRARVPIDRSPTGCRTNHLSTRGEGTSRILHAGEEHTLLQLIDDYLRTDGLLSVQCLLFSAVRLRIERHGCQISHPLTHGRVRQEEDDGCYQIYLYLSRWAGQKNRHG